MSDSKTGETVCEHHKNPYSCVDCMLAGKHGQSDKAREEFEHVWHYQQGALFLKRDQIYDLRKNLAEFFFREAYQAQQETISDLESNYEELDIEFEKQKKEIEWRKDAYNNLDKRCKDIAVENIDLNVKCNRQKNEIADLKYLLGRINEKVFPGEVDSIDSLRSIIKENEQWKLKMLNLDGNVQCPACSEVYSFATNRETYLSDIESKLTAYEAREKDLRAECDRLSILIQMADILITNNEAIHDWENAKSIRHN